MKRFFIPLIIAALLYGLACVNVESPDDTTKVNLNDNAPAFSYTTLDGKSISSDDLKGHVVLLTFFATWCPPCKKELPLIQSEIFEKISDPNFSMVVVGRKHTPEELKKFKDDNGYSFPIAADPDAKMYDLFASQYIPRNFIIGKDGTFKWISVGFEKSEFDKMLETIQSELNT